MSKSKQDELLKFDSRLTEYNIAKGNLTTAELEKHLAQLPDLTAQMMPLALEENKRGSDDESH